MRQQQRQKQRHHHHQQRRRRHVCYPYTSQMVASVYKQYPSLLFLVLQVLLLSCNFHSIVVTAATSTNNAVIITPVIGILTQPLSGNEEDSVVGGTMMDDCDDDHDHDYDDRCICTIRNNNTINKNNNNKNNNNKNRNRTMIAASYVKWIEAGGGRSIPIPYDATSTTLLDDILSQVDGVLFPGGSSDDVPFAATHIWKTLHSKQYYNNYHYNNDDGENNDEDKTPDMIPLWGTCLGFEFIVQLASSSSSSSQNNNNNNNSNHTVYYDDDSILEGGYDATNISLPLLNVQRTGLYHPDSIYYSVVQNNITMNNHHLGVTPQKFLQNENLVRMFDITSTNIDQNGKHFVSTIEPKMIVDNKKTSNVRKRRRSSPSSSSSLPPIYGVQFHPEKNAFEYGLYPHTNIPYEAIDHSSMGINLSVYMAQFFIGLARDNIIIRMNSDPSHYRSKYNKVDRYPVVYTYPREWGVKFEEIYIIPPASHWERDLIPSSTSSTTTTTTRP